MLTVALLGSGGCTAFNANDIGILPTSGIRSVEQSRPPAYPAVGVTPPAPAPQLTPEERDRIRTELEAARERNRAVAAQPLERPITQPRTP